MGHANKNTQTEPVHTKDSNTPVDTKPLPPPPVVGSDPGGVLDHQSAIPLFEPEPHGETAAGTVISFAGGEAIIVDNPSDMSREFAEVRLDLGSDRFVRLPGTYLVEKKRIA